MRALLNEIGVRERAIRQDRAVLRAGVLGYRRRAAALAGSLPGLAAGFGTGFLVGWRRPSRGGLRDTISLVRLGLPLVRAFLAGIDARGESSGPAMDEDPSG